MRVSLGIFLFSFVALGFAFAVGGMGGVVLAAFMLLLGLRT